MPYTCSSVYLWKISWLLQHGVLLYKAHKLVCSWASQATQLQTGMALQHATASLVLLLFSYFAAVGLCYNVAV